MSTDREIRDYLSDILESISDLRYLTEEMDFDVFCADKKSINHDLTPFEQAIATHQT